MPKTDWRTEFKRLWKDLVPLQGQANTVQGELVRAVGKLKDEAYRNGNQNFGANHRMLCKYVRETMADTKVFDDEEIKSINSSIHRVLDAEYPDVTGQTTCFHRLFEMTVRWCHAHPDLVPRKPNPRLRI